MGDIYRNGDSVPNPIARKVLIMGAGPVGATLAQILRNHQIPFEIFDRDPYMNTRRGGTFMLDSCLPHIVPLLPKDLGDMSVVSSNYNIGEQDTMAFINGIKCAVGMTLGAAPKGEPGFVISARRADFRSYMCQNIPVYFNKRLMRYEEDENGVTAYFQDGTHARGAVLIGADGASSPVRKQLLENPKPDINRHIPVCGTVELDREGYSSLQSLANSMVVANSPSCHVMISRIDVDKDRETARYWWLCSFKSENPEKDAEWVATASRKALFERALQSSKDLPEVIVEAIRRTGPEGLWDPQIKFTEFLAPDSLPSGRVTLIGDAAHNAAPFGGQGVNCGLRDAADLGRMLAEDMYSEGGREAVVKLLKRYEEIMLPRGRNVVNDARTKAECKHLLAPPNPNMVLPPGFKKLERPIMVDRANWEKSESAIAAAMAR